MIKKIVLEIKGTEFDLTIEELIALKRNIEKLIPPSTNIPKLFPDYTPYANPITYYDKFKMNSSCVDMSSSNSNKIPGI